MNPYIIQTYKPVLGIALEGEYNRLPDAVARASHEFMRDTGQRPQCVYLGQLERQAFKYLMDSCARKYDPALDEKNTTLLGLPVFWVDKETHLNVSALYNQ